MFNTDILGPGVFGSRPGNPSFGVFGAAWSETQDSDGFHTGGGGGGGVQRQQSPRRPAPALSTNNVVRAFSTNSPTTPSQSRPVFKCELCKKGFDTRHGLFTHFGKTTDHHPCKKRFGREEDEDTKICLRVFSTEAGLKQHITKQDKYPKHHQPDKPFPNLAY